MIKSRVFTRDEEKFTLHENAIAFTRNEQKPARARPIELNIAQRRASCESAQAAAKWFIRRIS